MSRKIAPEILRLKDSEQKFRELEKMLLKTKYPNNLIHKNMSMILETVRSFELVVTRYRVNRERLLEISIEATNWWRKHPNAKSRKSHPASAYVDAAIRVDVESLF